MKAVQRLKWLLIVELTLFAMAIVMVLGSRPDPMERIGSVWNDLAPVFWVGGFLIGLQLLILVPVWKPKPRRKRGVPAWVSLAAGAFVCASLVGMFVVAVLDALREPKTAAGHIWPAALAVAGVAWVVGTVLFVGFAASRRELSREWLLARITKGILKGTAFEALAILPLDIMIRRKSDCYCASGSVLAWAMCFAVGLIVFGPAALLPALARDRDEFYRDRCDACGERREAVDSTADGYRGPTEERCRKCGERLHTDSSKATGER